MATTTHEGLVPIPGDPRPAIDVLLKHLKDRDKPEICCTLQAAGHLYLYGVGLIHSHPPVASTECKKVCPADLTDCLEELKCCCEGLKSAASTVDINALLTVMLPMLVEFILSLLKK